MIDINEVIKTDTKIVEEENVESRKVSFDFSRKRLSLFELYIRLYQVHANIFVKFMT